ncbi:MAG: hypothetical protein H6Q37_2155 [Chloroflexi bacterium]|nr:hypothetical protein [Chloroflexota bacterium]
MNEFVELEIGLHQRDTGSYAVEFRFTQPNSEADVRIDQRTPAQASLDLTGLNQLVLDPKSYGQRLTQDFFADPTVLTAFAQARASAQTSDLPLRIRLMIGPSAPELHKLHWETLCDPQDASPLSTNGNILFSRYLSSQDWRPVRLRARGELRALTFIANPSDLGDYNLSPIDVAAEFGRVKQALKDISLSSLPGPGGSQPATLNNLMDRLRANDVDILYLVCHGALVKGEPWLWLEGDDGKVTRASGTELITQLKELEERPRLVVLASCESAGNGSGEALAALGPRLAEAGIPAVLAMQGKISMETIAGFMPVFFRELQRDGQIDRALAVARRAVAKRPDYWMPALFMRLKSGRIWYVPGFGDVKDEFEKWQSLAGFIQDKTCTPILGPGLSENVLGSHRDIAIRWAEEHGFPLEPHDRGSLPQVAQYIITQQSPAYLPVAYRGVLRDGIICRYPTGLPEELLQAKTWTTAQLGRAVGLVADLYKLENPADPYRTLAGLRLPIYVTTSTLDFMTQALVEAGADPVVRICPWNKWVPKEKAIYEDEPTIEKPLVYHLFGHMSVPNSLVFSEDNFFDYLIGVTQNKSLIPSAVRAALNNTSLLFLGFQMDNWEFRVFFRFLLMQEGREMLKFFSHAAAQIEPDEDRIVDLKRARKYLEEYFESENIAIFWGSTEEFLKGLSMHL